MKSARNKGRKLQFSKRIAQAEIEWSAFWLSTASPLKSLVPWRISRAAVAVRLVSPKLRMRPRLNGMASQFCHGTCANFTPMDVGVVDPFKELPTSK
jgi:hypothetical protein